MSRWFRMYDEMLDDPKVQMLSPELFKTWVNILALASRTGGRLPEVSRMAFSLRVGASDMQSKINDLILAGLIDILPDKSLEPHNWSRRQWKSDDSADRVRRHRDRKKQQRVEVATETPQETHRNADVTVTVTPPETDTETETEKCRSPLPPRAGGGDDDPPDHVRSVQSWDTAFARPSPEIAMRGAAVVLLDGARTFWLDQFGGIDADLDLALMQAAGEIRPNSRTHPLEAQVSRVLARIVQERRDRDRRYQAATERNVATRGSRPSTDFAQQRIDRGKQVLDLIRGTA